MSGGVSCKPFSQARTGRWQEDEDRGYWAHKDADLSHAFVAAVKKAMPLVAYLENVFGYTLGSKGRLSPLQHFIALVKKELPMYTATVYSVDSIVWLVFNRRRVYITLIKDTAGGQAAADKVTFVIKICLGHRLSLPACTSDDIMLPDDHPDVIKQQHAMEMIKPHVHATHREGVVYHMGGGVVDHVLSHGRGWELFCRGGSRESRPSTP